MLIGDILFLAIFLGIGFFFVLNGLRYFKYNKLSYFPVEKEIFSDDMHGGRAAFSIIFGGLFLIFPMIFFFHFLRVLGIVFGAILSILFVYAFYWYWHTEKDPFAFDKVWEDPRDKKKKEPK